ncbi:hypothetical protein BL243_07945 [Ralstonia solanacearum]|nr:hypothetical protein BL243_07945 [Ralstonia solanacearum]
MTALFIVKAILCAAIALRLLLFRREGAAHRPWASRLAYVLIVLTGAVPICVLFGRYDWALVAHTGILALLCLAVFAVRGNVVELFRVGGADSSCVVRFLRRLA